MPVPTASVVYDVHDCKVYPLSADPVGGSPAYGAAVDVPGIAEFSLSPNFVTQELKGDATVLAKKGRIDKFTGSLTYGKIALQVLVTALGGAVVTTGTDPNEVATYGFVAANSLADFKIEVSIEDVETGLGNIVVVLYKCQVTGGDLFSQSSDEFGQPSLEFDAIALESNQKMIDVSFNQTLAALSA